MDAARLNWLTATEAARLLADGAISAEQYVQSCVARIQEVEPTVQAWAHFDPEFALRQAREADLRRAQGHATGPLHGIPVGLKDIIDTRALPTEDGTVLHAGRQPARDAAVVAALAADGAVLMGKTVTTELATYAPGKTRNPHRPQHTPGGSSSGSAAAVAAGMVPLAIGTQTNGSVIRPASFCGVFGYKPTFGWIPRTGILTQSPPLDQVGMFARTVEDLALVAESLVGHDEDDPATAPRARPALRALAASQPPLPPRLALVRTPFWDRMEEDARAAFDELADVLGEHAQPFDLPPTAQRAVEWHRTVMEADLAASFEAEYERGREQLSASLRGQIERGRQVTAVEYRKAVERIAVVNDGFASLFEQFDAIVTPAALGTAPAGLDATGDPVMCTLWTYAGMPAVSAPLLHGANGLPIGVQLVGARHADARLLRTTRWLCDRMRQAAEA